MSKDGNDPPKTSLPSTEDSLGFIEEYKELRAEIRMYLDRRTKNVQLAFLFVFAVIGLYEKVNSPYFYLAASIVVAFIWFDHIRQHRAVVRTATYLEVFVEPNVKGLNWETYASAHPITMRKGNRSSFVERAVSNGVFPLFFVALGAITIIEKAISWPYEVRIGVACILALFLWFLGYSSYDRLDREEQLEIWGKLPAKGVETDK
jgi:Na+-transporting methylmalonyl-CoA/oxaloacetate decarboxylase beta subunit